MGKLAEEVAWASEELAPTWDEARSARLLSGIRVKQQRRAQTQRVASVLCATLVLVAGASWAMRGEHKGAQPAQAANAATASTPDTIHDGHTIRLLDGSSAQLSGEHSEL